MALNRNRKEMAKDIQPSSGPYKIDVGPYYTVYARTNANDVKDVIQQVKAHDLKVYDSIDEVALEHKRRSIGFSTDSYVQMRVLRTRLFKTEKAEKFLRKGNLVPEAVAIYRRNIYTEKKVGFKIAKAPDANKKPEVKSASIKAPSL